MLSKMNSLFINLCTSPVVLIYLLIIAGGTFYFTVSKFYADGILRKSLNTGIHSSEGTIFIKKGLANNY